MQNALLNISETSFEPTCLTFPKSVSPQENTAFQNFRHANYLSITMIYARLIEKAVLSCGITTTQYRILIRLSAHKEPLRIGRLAEMLDIGASAVTATISQLHDMGAVKRLENNCDHRTVRIYITPIGIKRALVVEQAIAPLMKKIIENIPADLRAYASSCTLRAAEKNGLLGTTKRHASIHTVLCDEILFTATLASHVTREEGLSLIGYRLLLSLFDKQNGLRPNELAQSLGLRPNGIATTQTELLRREFIQRTRDPQDRRAVIIEITSNGYGVLRRTSSAVASALDTQICPDLETEDFMKHLHIANHVLKTYASPLHRVR